MPGKKVRGATLKAAAAKTDALREAGRGLLEKLEEQVRSLTQMADENLEQGLLGHYAEAMKMRGSAEQTLKDLRRKLGLPEVEGDEMDGLKDVSRPRGGGKAAALQRLPERQQKEAKGSPESEEAARQHAPVKQQEDGPEGGKQPQPGGGISPPVPDAAIKHVPERTGTIRSPLMPRYNWLPAEGDGCVLEILGPRSASVGSDAPADEVPDVDISDGAVRCRWEASGWQLTVPVGFQVDQARCKVVRRRRTGRLELQLAFAAAAPSPDRLRLALCSPGFGFHDGFLAAAEADAVRDRLLELWEGGHLQQGEVEGGVRQKVRSDSYLFMEEGDEVISTFTRRLDRFVLSMAKEVPELKGLWLMRGRPMAAVYAGAGSRYAPHFDCVAGDNGRKITCIMYLNPFWQPGNGAELQIFPEARGIIPSGSCHEIEPLHGRLACFLCDSKNLHAVKPVEERPNLQPRMAISCWYYDSEGGKFHREDENDARRPRDYPQRVGGS